jgi:hypothetical protein
MRNLEGDARNGESDPFEEPIISHSSRWDKIGFIYGAHCMLALWHLALSLACFILAGVNGSSTREVGYRAYDLTGYNASSPIGDFFNTFKWISAGSVSLKYMAGSFFLLTAISHAGQSRLYKVDRDNPVPLAYYWVIKVRCNVFQWIEYAITVPPLMSIALAVIAGERNVLDFMNRGGCELAMIFCGYLSERHRESSFRYFFMGCFFALLPLIQDIVLLTAVPTEQVPVFVKTIIATTYIFFFSFTIPAFAEIWTVRMKKACHAYAYEYTILAGMFLSGTTKTFMGMYILFADP